MPKSLILAAIAGSVSMLFTGFVFYAVLFDDLFREGAVVMPGVMKQSPDVVWILTGQAGMGVLTTLMVSWRGKTSLLGGAQTGAIFGFLMAIGYDFAQYGTSNLWTLKATLADPFITAGMFAVAGGVIGWILGRAPQESPRAE